MLAIAVPLAGYGAAPTIVALIAYGILPVVDNTIAGLRGVSPAALGAAEGMGLTPRQTLFWVELPLAAPVILAGIRTSVIINIGTAAIGSTVGALSLGSPIIEGLSGSNTAYVIQGAVVVGLLAIAVDQLFALADARLSRATGAQLIEPVSCCSAHAVSAVEPQHLAHDALVEGRLLLDVEMADGLVQLVDVDVFEPAVEALARRQPLSDAVGRRHRS